MRYASAMQIGAREISPLADTYFIADIAANHDGDLERARKLIWDCKAAGADAAKFQHFQAADIVSDVGFRSLGGQMAHQSKWKKSVYQVYEQFSLERDWSETLAATCREADIEFMSTPYDFAAVDHLEPLVGAYKVGSGDISWTAELDYIARKGKPVLLATGAAGLDDVERAVEAILASNPQLVLMQCNTNYTGSQDNFRHVNLNVLRSFAVKYPGMVLGLSDHTPGHAAVLGAVALGARVVEKHFTDDNDREGPDHPFSMTPGTWREMVDRTRELEAALGDGVKRVEANEHDSAVVQRRCLRLRRDMAAGETLSADDLVALRPAPVGACQPYQDSELTGRRLAVAKRAGEALFPADFA